MDDTVGFSFRPVYLYNRGDKKGPKNMVRKSQPNSGKQNLSVTPQAPAPTSNSETVREAIMRELSTNSKWKEDKTSGKVSVIVGHRR